MKFLVIVPISDEMSGVGCFVYFFYLWGQLMDRARVGVVAFCTTVLVAFASSFATADVVYNNLGPGDTFSVGGRILVGPDNGAFGDINQAASFSVGPTAHYLTDVVLGLGVLRRFPCLSCAAKSTKACLQRSLHQQKTLAR